MNAVMNADDAGAFVGTILLAGLRQALHDHITAHGLITWRGEPHDLPRAMEDHIPVQKLGYIWVCWKNAANRGCTTHEHIFELRLYHAPTEPPNNIVELTHTEALVGATVVYVYADKDDDTRLHVRMPIVGWDFAAVST